MGEKGLQGLRKAPSEAIEYLRPPSLPLTRGQQGGLPLSTNSSSDSVSHFSEESGVRLGVMRDIPEADQETPLPLRLSPSFPRQPSDPLGEATD